MIEIQGVKKHYHKSDYFLEIQQLSMKENKIYGFIGNNGAGKTTLIRILLGLLKADEGSIKINGNEMLRSPEEKRKIGYVPDKPNLYESLSGYEHLEFVAGLYGIENINEIDRWLDYFELYEERHKSISSYSKGMKQKISIISGLIHNPEILILDEPFTGLDPMAIKKVKEYLQEFIKKEHNVVLFSTHDLDVANNLCTDAIIIKNGRIVAEKDKSEIEKNGLEKLFFKYMNQEK